MEREVELIETVLGEVIVVVRAVNDNEDPMSLNGDPDYEYA